MGGAGGGGARGIGGRSSLGLLDLGRSALLLAAVKRARPSAEPELDASEESRLYKLAQNVLQPALPPRPIHATQATPTSFSGNPGLLPKKNSQDTKSPLQVVSLSDTCCKGPQALRTKLKSLKAEQDKKV